MKRLTLSLLLVVFAVLAASAATAPTWVANEPGTGFVPVYTTAVGDVTIKHLEVTTGGTAVYFSLWSYAGDEWNKVRPLNSYGGAVAATDTALYVPANSVRGYTVSRIDALYVVQGDAFFSGE